MCFAAGPLGNVWHRNDLRGEPTQTDRDVLGSLFRSSLLSEAARSVPSVKGENYEFSDPF
jgi:hypothetical protein